MHRGRRPCCRRGAAHKGVASKRRRPTDGNAVKSRSLGAAGGNLIAKNAQAREEVLRLVDVGGGVRVGSEHLGTVGLALGDTEDILVSLELVLESLVALLEQLLLVLDGLELCLHALVLLLEAGDQLLELHAADLWLELLRKVLGHFIFLADEVNDDEKHKIDEVDGTLHNVFLGLREALAGVPSGPLEEEVMDTAVQFAVQLAQVLATVAFGNPVLLALVIGIGGDHAPLALASAELLQGRLAIDVSGSDKGHYFILGEITGPLHGLLGGKRVLPSAVLGVCGRGRGHHGLRCWPR